MRRSKTERVYQCEVSKIKECVGDPVIGCEVGVWKGNLSHYLLSAFENLTLYMVDSYLPSKTIRGTYKHQHIMFDAMEHALSVTLPYETRRILITGMSMQVVHLVPDRSLDFVYIDAGHNYKDTRNDINAWYPKVRSGGLVSGHDYNRKHEGVKKAVNEFIEKHRYALSTSKLSIWSFQKGSNDE